MAVEQPRERGSEGLVSQPLPAVHQGEHHVSKPVVSVRYMVDASIAWCLHQCWKRSLAGRYAEVATDSVGSDARQLHPVDGVIVTAPQR
jgi:hypothetical protein